MFLHWLVWFANEGKKAAVALTPYRKKERGKKSSNNLQNEILCLHCMLLC